MLPMDMKLFLCATSELRMTNTSQSESARANAELDDLFGIGLSDVVPIRTPFSDL